MPQLPDFDEICDLFIQLDSEAQPAEMHGLAVGQICAGRQLNAQQWLALLSDFMGVDLSEQQPAQPLLLGLLATSQSQLEDPELAFEPLLSDDDHEIDVRLEALSQWCQGFINGFALVSKDPAQWPELVSDAMEDMTALSQVGLDDDDEGAEEAYAEVYEYLRLLTLNIYLEMHPPADEPAQQTAAADSSVLSQAPNAVASEAKPIEGVQSLFGKPTLH